MGLCFNFTGQPTRWCMAVRVLVAKMSELEHWQIIVDSSTHLFIQCASLPASTPARKIHHVISQVAEETIISMRSHVPRRGYILNRTWLYDLRLKLVLGFNVCEGPRCKFHGPRRTGYEVSLLTRLASF